jgi:HEXXH motif-containing protein
MEYPELPRLASFYQEHGLEPLATDELVATQASEKLRRAWALLESIPATGASLRELVKTIQVLRSPDPEIDVSYSHPAIPFSIFVSVGEDESLNATLRVAESLLHEAMHLKLTLLEQEINMVHPGSQGLYYSPWRDENRPVRGVLHGMFVFVAVREFYQIMQCRGLPEPAQDFCAYREEVITAELALLTDFPKSADLTAAGSQLAANLLKQATAAGNLVP